MGGPLRVLHVVVNMNRGGAETLIMNLYRNIDRSKVQFDFLTCKEGVFDNEILELGGKIHRIPYISDVGHFGYVKALNHFFKEHNSYKIVHSHLDKMSGLVLRAASKAGIPVRIGHSHNTQSEGGIMAKIYKTYSGRYIKSCSTHNLACSNAAAEWLFGQKAKAVVLKNGIDYEKFRYSKSNRETIREEFNITKDTLVIGHVGRFNNQKNHSFLVEIFASLNKQVQDSVLILVGDGFLRAKIEQRVKELKLENKVLFLGVRPDINMIMQGFDVFLFPSLHEGLPVTLIEAQAVGLPCIISDRISKEVDLGANLIDYESLSSLNSWVSKILTTNKKVINTVEFIKGKGYYIGDSAKYLEKYYLNTFVSNEEKVYGENYVLSKVK